MDLLKSHSSLDYESTLKSLKASRARAAVVNKSLLTLSVECICGNAKLFNCDSSENPLCILPNTLVQKFLRHASVQGCELDLVICMLSSGAVTEFDFSSNNKWSQEDRKQIYRKLVLKCPRLRKITMPALWLERKRLYSGAEEIDSAWTKWGELREADFRGHCFTDDVLRSALVGCPKLEKLLFSIHLGSFNKKFTDCIVNMGCLRELHVDVNYFQLDKDLQNSAHLLARIAERAPKITKLNSSLFDDPEFCRQFLLVISKIILKHLIIGKFTLIEFPDFCWPQLIRTNKLTLIGTFKESFVGKICTYFDAEHIQVLEFDGVLPNCMYPVMEAFGHSIRHLVIKSTEHSLDRRETQTLNLNRVLASTRKLETFDFTIPLKLESNAKYDLRLNHFENMTDFKVEILSWDGSQSEMRSIYKLYLLGADKCRILSIQTKELLDTALETVKLHPECGQRIEQLHLEIYRMDMLENAIQLATLLALRSPVLTVVVLKSVSREYNIAGQLDTNHQWFQHFLSEINVCLNVIDSKTQHEEISDSD